MQEARLVAGWASCFWAQRLAGALLASWRQSQLSGASHGGEGCDAGLGDLAILLRLDA